MTGAMMQEHPGRPPGIFAPLACLLAFQRFAPVSLGGFRLSGHRFVLSSARECQHRPRHGRHHMHCCNSRMREELDAGELFSCLEQHSCGQDREGRYCMQCHSLCLRERRNARRDRHHHMRCCNQRVRLGVCFFVSFPCDTTTCVAAIGFGAWRGSA